METSSPKLHMKTKTLECIKMLQAYKKMSDLPDNHNQLLKEKTMLLFIANLLATKNEEILQLCLDILVNFVDVNKNHQAILNVFGLYEGLSYLAIKTKKYSKEIIEKVNYVCEQLKTAMKRPRTNRVNFRKYNVYNLYLSDLTVESKCSYEVLLLEVQGIVSFVIDLESNSCMIRTCSPHKIQDIIKAIRGLSGATPLLIVFNDKGIKEYVDAFDSPAQDLQYDDEKSFAEAPISFFRSTFSHTKNRIKTLLETVNDHFYW